MAKGVPIVHYPRVEIGIGIVLVFAVLIWPDPPAFVKWLGVLIGVGVIAWGVFGLWRGARCLTKKQKDTIAREIKERGWTADDVWIRFAAGCEECRIYAEDFADAFGRAGWNDTAGTTLDEQPELEGLRIVVADYSARSQTAKAVAAALTAAKVSFEWWSMPTLQAERVVVWAYKLR